jgi:hypothetical protein
MCPAAMWIVVGLEIRRSHDEVALDFGFAALPRQRIRSPEGTKPALRPYFLLSSEIASARLQSRLRSPLAQASSTGPGRSTVRRA